MVVGSNTVAVTEKSEFSIFEITKLVQEIKVCWTCPERSLKRNLCSDMKFSNKVIAKDFSKYFFWFNKI